MATESKANSVAQRGAQGDAHAGAGTSARPGAASAATTISESTGPLAGAAANPPRVSGSLDSHYAPRTRTVLAPRHEVAHTLAQHPGKRVAVLSFSPTRVPNTLHWLASGQVRVYAHNLYANLRAMDTAGCDLILIESPPQNPEWDGINDRLQRAAFGEQ